MLREKSRWKFLGEEEATQHSPIVDKNRKKAFVMSTILQTLLLFRKSPEKSEDFCSFSSIEADFTRLIHCHSVGDLLCFVVRG